MTATLSLSRIRPHETPSNSELHYLVECKRCHASGGVRIDDVDDLISRIDKLPDADREALVYLTGEKVAGFLFTIWANYRHLQEADKQAVLARMKERKAKD